MDHLLQLGDGAVGTGHIGLVDDEDVADFQNACLQHLDVVAAAGLDEHGHGVGGADDVDLVLSGTDRLDDDLVLAEGVECLHGVRCRGRQAS